MIRENNKSSFVKEMESFFRKTNACEEIELTYGSLKRKPLECWSPGAVLLDCYDDKTNTFYQKYFLEEFTPSDTTLKNGREYVKIKLCGKTVYACVEMDSYYGIILDVLKKMKEENM